MCTSSFGDVFKNVFEKGLAEPQENLFQKTVSLSIKEPQQAILKATKVPLYDIPLGAHSKVKDSLTPKKPQLPEAPRTPKTPSYSSFYARNLPSARNSTILTNSGVGSLSGNLGRNTLLGQ